MRIVWTDICCATFGAALVGIIHGVYMHNFGPHFQGYCIAGITVICAFGLFRYFEEI